MSSIVITSAKRTPIGKFLGGLSDLSATELGSVVLKNIIKESDLNPDEIDEVILGQVLSGGCGQNPARQTSFMSEILTPGRPSKLCSIF